MATLNITLEITNQTVIDTITKVVSQYEGVTLQDRVKSYLKVKITDDVNKQIRADTINAMTNIDDIEA